MNKAFLILYMVTSVLVLNAQNIDTDKPVLLSQDEFTSEPLDIDFQKRKKYFWATGITGYSAMATGLYFAWYDQYEQESFHFFNDWDEWRNVDKVGHSYSAYFQTSLIHNAAKWAGYSDNKALNISSLASIWGQLNIELMDGFSSEWGFSATDLTANVLGTGLYYIQQKTWKEQRLTMKMSYWPIKYSEAAIFSESGLLDTSLKDRSRSLFGNSGIERFLKDYNGQTIWLSANVRSFFPESRWPKFLSLALGYSANNLYGGFNNTWKNNNENFNLDTNLYPRSSQFILALDYDLLSVYHSTTFGKALFKVLNIFKFPAPAVSYDTIDGFKFHLMFLN